MKNPQYAAKAFPSDMSQYLFLARVLHDTELPVCELDGQAAEEAFAAVLRDLDRFDGAVTFHGIGGRS